MSNSHNHCCYFTLQNNNAQYGAAIFYINHNFVCALVINRCSNADSKLAALNTQLQNIVLVS